MSELYRFFVHRIHLWVYVLLMAVSSYLTYRNNLIFQHHVNDTVLELTGLLNAPARSWSKMMYLEENNLLLLEENKNLRTRILNSKENIHKGFKIKTAGIVSRYTNGFNDFIIIDKGTKDSININDGVWTSNGVVGIVTNVSPHFSKVALLTNPKISISVKTGNPPKNGFTSPKKIRGKYVIGIVDLPDELNAAIGDTVRTSGNSLIFPPGLPLGTIREIKSDGTEKTVEISPTVHIDKINYVYIGFHPLKQELIDLIRE